MKQYKDQVLVRLKSKDRKEILVLIQKGKESGRVMKRALVLRLMDQGGTSPDTARSLGMTAMTARNIAQRYNRHGLGSALYDRPRPGQPRQMDQKSKEIESLQQKFERAKDQVQDIAVKAIEEASGTNALSHVNRIAIEQAKGKSQESRN